MIEPVARMISPREMIGLAELCEGAGDHSFALLMVECALAALSADCPAGASDPPPIPATAPRCLACSVMMEQRG